MALCANNPHGASVQERAAAHADAEAQVSTTYRLVLADDGLGMARTIEFEAACADSALYPAQQQCRGREAELFEDERTLGRIQCARQGGFWVLSRARQA